MGRAARTPNCPQSQTNPGANRNPGKGARSRSTRIMNSSVPMTDHSNRVIHRFILNMNRSTNSVHRSMNEMDRSVIAMEWSIEILDRSVPAVNHSILCIERCKSFLHRPKNFIERSFSEIDHSMKMMERSFSTTDSSMHFAHKCIRTTQASIQAMRHSIPRNQERLKLDRRPFRLRNATGSIALRSRRETEWRNARSQSNRINRLPTQRREHPIQQPDKADDGADGTDYPKGLPVDCLLQSDFNLPDLQPRLLDLFLNFPLGLFDL